MPRTCPNPTGAPGRIRTRQYLVYFGAGVDDHARGPRFVNGAAGKRLLEQVREGAMPDVVQQRCRHRIARAVGRQALPEGQRTVDLLQSNDERMHHVRGAHGMRKAGVIGAWVGEGSQSELPDSAQALHFARFE